MIPMDRADAQVFAHVERVALTLREVFDRDPAPIIGKYLNKLANLPKATRNLLAHEEPYWIATEWAAISLSEQQEDEASERYEKLAESQTWVELDRKAELLVEQNRTCDLEVFGQVDPRLIATRYASIEDLREAERVERLLLGYDWVETVRVEEEKAAKERAPLALTHRPQD